MFPLAAPDAALNSTEQHGLGLRLGPTRLAAVSLKHEGHDHARPALANLERQSSGLAVWQGRVSSL